MPIEMVTSMLRGALLYRERLAGDTPMQPFRHKGRNGEIGFRHDDDERNGFAARCRLLHHNLT
jgi:hypothetical protein